MISISFHPKYGTRAHGHPHMVGLLKYAPHSVSPPADSTAEHNPDDHGTQHEEHAYLHSPKSRVVDQIQCALTAKTATTEMSNNNKAQVPYVYEGRKLVLLGLSSFIMLMYKYQHLIQLNLRSTCRLKYANILWFTSENSMTKLCSRPTRYFPVHMRNLGCGRNNHF
jgi:hypothetical protein